MQIAEAVKKHKGKPYFIKGATSYDLAKFIKDHGCKVGVEIGVYQGVFTKMLADTGLERIYGIDPWGIFYDYPNFDSKYLQKQQELFNHAKKVLDPYENVTLIRKTSMDAVVSFPTESIDFVYIDGNHKFKYIAEDLYEWAKRVRLGGIVAGHDYYNSTDSLGLVRCKDIIDAYVKSYSIKNFYTLAGHLPRYKSKGRDRWLSWFWIKK